MSGETIYPCEGSIHPRIINNLPGKDNIAYRVGDFSTFRHALLQPLFDSAGNPIENELINWQPALNGDLTLQLVEWWAYIADILTFYNERIATETYLRTATQPESVQRLIRLLGYRPRPGIGASGLVAALLAPGAKNAVLLQGMGLQNKPVPGKQPQIFELDQTTKIGLPDAVPADIAPKFILDLFSVKSSATANDNSLLLKGEISGLKPGESLLLVEKGWKNDNKNYRWLTINEISVVKDPRGKANTRIKFDKGFQLWPNFDMQNVRLLASSQLVHLWTINGSASVFDQNKVHLDKLAKNIATGDMLLFERDAGDSDLFSVKSYEEVLWYANSSEFSRSTAPSPPTPPIAVLHSVIGLAPIPELGWNSGSTNIRYSWKEIGQLIDTPPTSFDNKNPARTVPALIAAESAETSGRNSSFPPSLDRIKVFLEDSDDQGLLAYASTDSTGSTLTLSGLTEQSSDLKPPLKALFNLLSVSRGKSVNNEILGSGDAGVPGQEFVLKNAPLTYFLSSDSRSGDNYKSTLRVWVDGIEWIETPSFFGKGSKDRIFVTREDENLKTHVLFGDGVNGARLPSGINNILTAYRFGSGEDAPSAGSLTIIQQPQPGLKAIRNPVAVGGGADPDPPSKIRKNAPRSVLAFGRAVSADDYEVIAAQAPGVRRAKLMWGFDTFSQKALPVIYVGDEVSAVDSARQAIRLTADPNRPFTVRLARKTPLKLQLKLIIAGNYATEPVIEEVHARLIDMDSGLFGANNVGIGQTFFQSGIDSACLKVDGVEAVHEMRLFSDRGIGFVEETSSRYDPGTDGFYYLTSENLSIAYEQVTL